MKANELNKGVAAVKIRAIKKQGDVVYDGDPSNYEWRASTIKNNFDQLNSLLGKLGRKFERLLITKDGNKRYFIASSSGTPEVLYYFQYDAYGHNTSVYIDWLRIKTPEFLALPQDEQIKLLSTVVHPDPAAIWKKERAIEVIGAALEGMDKATVDKTVDSLGSKFLAAISKFECDSVSIHKLAEFVRSLDKIDTPKTKKLADLAVQAFKKKVMVDLLTEIKEMRFGPMSIVRQIILLKRSGFDWAELDTMLKSLKDESIKTLLQNIKNRNVKPENILGTIASLKRVGVNWPELDTIEKSLKVGQIT